MGKYTGTFSEKDKLSVSFSHQASKWNASGQIPQRAVDAGIITRFGSITFAGGISFRSPSGFGGSIKTRWLGDRPANEDNSIVAKGYCITDMNISYSCKK